MLKKFFIILVFAFIILSSCFSEEWKICLGSFKNFTNAEKHVELLKEHGIHSNIQDYRKSRSEIYYRVIYEESLPTKESAIFHINLFTNHPTIKDLGINDIWFIKVQSESPIEEITEESLDTVPENIPVVEPEKRTIVVRDSDSGNPIPLADVNIDEVWDMKSDDEGKVELPNQIQDGEHKMTVKKGEEYVKTESSFTLDQGILTTVPQISLPKKVDFKRIKIVLDWGEYPYDLDSHVLDEKHHVYYSNMTQGNLELDRDDTSSYGPETITIKDPDPNSVYKYFVHDYSNGGHTSSDELSYSEAQVKVYFDNEFKSSFQIKPNQEGITWYVFDIVDGNKIVTKDIVSSITPSSY